MTWMPIVQALFVWWLSYVIWAYSERRDYLQGLRMPILMLRWASLLLVALRVYELIHGFP